MNTENSEIKSHKIIVIEWLNEGDHKTGKDLYDDVLRYKTSNAIPVSSNYFFANSKVEFAKIFQEIYFNISDGDIVTLDIETHGAEHGIGLNQNDFLTWEELFRFTRPINIKCGGLLLITLSMCFGLANIIGVTPDNRAPFGVILGANREMYPDELYACLSEFYKGYDSPLNLSIAINALNQSFKENGKESPFLPISSLLWFDEFFKESRILEVAENNAQQLANSEGIDVNCAKWQIIEDMRDKRKENRDYFNFFDTLSLTDVPLQYLKHV